MLWSAPLSFGASMNSFTEWKRRHFYRVAAAHIVVAWVLIQLANNVTPTLNLPNVVRTAVLVLLTVGFSVAVVIGLVSHQQPRPSRLATTSLQQGVVKDGNNA